MSSSTTGADLVAEVRNHLLRGAREELNKLNGALAASAAAITLTYPVGGAQAGARVSVDLEDFYVWSVAGQVLTTEPAQFGTTTAAHANGALVTVNPRWSNADIFRAINDELDSLSGEGLYRMRAIDVTYNASIAGYDLTGVTDMLGEPYELRYKQTGSSKYWPTIPNTSWNISREMATTEFPSGIALFLFGGGQAGQPIRVRYRANFARLAALTDVVATVSGIHPEATDLVALGAAIRLAAGRAVHRSQTERQGPPRRAEESSTGDVTNSIAGLAALRQRRLATESARLAARYPTYR